MADAMYEPRSIQVLSQGLEIQWRDDHRTLLSGRYLRGNCGCAQCVDEITHVRHVGVEDVPADIMVEDYLDIGQYAVEVLFSDLHSTGIYPFTVLRDLCSCGECQVLRAAETGQR